MPTVTDTPDGWVVALENIQDTASRFARDLADDFGLKIEQLPAAVDTNWIRQHASIIVPKHMLAKRLRALHLSVERRRLLIQVFDQEVLSLRSDALMKACHDLREIPDTYVDLPQRRSAERLVRSAQLGFERRMQELEDKLVARCATHLRYTSSKCHPKPIPHVDEYRDGVDIKEEHVSDDELPPTEVDPKQYHNMLEYIFCRGVDKPSRPDKMAFVARTGLPYRTITVWFQNRRSRGALGGRCGWQEKQRMRSLGMTDEQILMLDDLGSLDPISSSSAEEPLESELEAAGSETDIGEVDQGCAAVQSDLSETEAEFDESEWETDTEDTPDTSTPFCGIRRVPSLTRSVSTTSSASLQLHHSTANSDVESRASSPIPDVPRRSYSPVSILPPAFNYRAARQLRSPSPAPSVHSKSPLLNDDAKLPPLDTPQLNAPFRLGSWRTNHDGSSFSQTLVTMQVPQIRQHTPSLSLSPVSDGEDQVLDAPSPTESENGPVTPPTVTGFTFPSPNSSQLTDTQTQTPKQFVFGPNTPLEALPSNPSSSPGPPTASFTFSPQQPLSTASPRVESSTLFVSGQRQAATPPTPSVTPPKFTFGSFTPPSSLPSPSTPFKFGTVHGTQVCPSPPKFNFPASSPHVTTSHTSNVRSSSGGLYNYSTPYTGGRQSSPTIVASQFRIPSPGSFDFSNPRPPSPKSDSSARKFTLPSVFTFGMPPPASVTTQSAQAPGDNAPQKASHVPFTFGNEDLRHSSTTFAFGDNTLAAVELVSDCNTLPISSQLRRLTSPTAIVHISSPPASTSSSTPIVPTARNPVTFSSKAQAAISQPTPPAVKGKTTLVLKPRKPSVLQKHAAAAESLSFVSSSRHPSSSSSKDKGKMPAHDLFAAAPTSCSRDEISQLDILADAALASTEQDGNDADLEIAASAPLPFLNEYNDSDADSDGHEGDDEDEPLMGNVLPPVRAIPPTTISTSPPSSAFSFSFPAPNSLAAPRLPKFIITEDIRQRVTSFTQNYLTPGVAQRPAVTLAGRG